jgi:hypothetical protein
MRFGSKQRQADTASADAAYEHHRGSARSRGYTAAWDKAARAFKVEHPLCCGCAALGEVAPTELVDHVVPHKGDDRAFWDRRNWQPSCRWHHDVVKQAIERRWQAGALPEAALRLGSQQAIAISREMRAGGG